MKKINKTFCFQEQYKYMKNYFHPISKLKVLNFLLIIYSDQAYYASN